METRVEELEGFIPWTPSPLPPVGSGYTHTGDLFLQLNSPDSKAILSLVLDLEDSVSPGAGPRLFDHTLLVFLSLPSTADIPEQPITLQE